MFLLSGFWSSATGDMCMVGSGTSYLRYVNVVLKLHYPSNSTVVTSLVNGTLRSLDQEGTLAYFDPISILGLSQMGYSYSLIDSEIGNGGFSGFDGMENVSLGLELGRTVCSVIRPPGRFEMDYISGCGSVNCNFLGGGDKNLPGFMTFKEVECMDNGRVRWLLGFSNTSRPGFQLAFDPNTTFVAEGMWDLKKKRLSLVACRICNTSYSLDKSFVGDCSIRLILRLPSTFTLRNRSSIVGEMWSNRSSTDSSYFGRVGLRSPENKHPKLGNLKYDYTQIDNVEKHCTKKMTVKRKGGGYPSGYSSDMRFDMTLRNRKGKMTWGYSSPLSVGDKFYEPLSMFADQVEPAVHVNDSTSSVYNISYVMSFTKNHDLKLSSGFPTSKSVEISAEGRYDAKTGLLCMIGCRHIAYENMPKNHSLDCEVLINAQYPPLKKGGNVKGTIESTRTKSDPLYFERLEFSSSSIYTNQAKESIWNMDLEISMVLISNTLACIFVGLQLLYVKKNPGVLPFISVVMLVVLTLAHMIPLLLNFEALFLANHRQSVFLGRDGWLEVNEVLVRVITMIAFLLQFRLLQLTWSARVGDETQKYLWVSDKKVLYIALPLYIAGGLMAWFVHLYRKSSHTPLLQHHHFGYQQLSFWGELKSYAGLVLDGFLLPQIVFNLFCDTREMVLAPSYYIGTTVVRLLPHAYDLYRTHSSSWFFNYIYANPRMDYYSTAWDIVISSGGLFFVFLIYLQQRFGGRCFLPGIFRKSCVYEKVPVVSTE